MPRLRLRGLMAIPEPTDDRRYSTRAFAAVRDSSSRLREDGLALDTLSWMSDDMEAAIAEGRDHGARRHCDFRPAGKCEERGVRIGSSVDATWPAR